MVSPHGLDDMQMRILTAQACNLAQNEWLTDKKQDFTILLYKWTCELIAAQKVLPSFFLNLASQKENGLREHVKKENPLPKVNIEVKK